MISAILVSVLCSHGISCDYFQPSAIPQLEQTPGSVATTTAERGLSKTVPEASAGTGVRKANAPELQKEPSIQKAAASSPPTVPLQTVPPATAAPSSKRQSKSLRIFKQLWISKSLFEAPLQHKNQAMESTETEQITDSKEYTARRYTGPSRNSSHPEATATGKTAGAAPTTSGSSITTADLKSEAPLVDVSRFVSKWRGKSGKRSVARSHSIHTAGDEASTATAAERKPESKPELEAEPELAIGRKLSCMPRFFFHFLLQIQAELHSVFCTKISFLIQI
ncbi:unnamed protein product [Gongylonema pulchrum]|uniref:Secreted mucin n=1 Tax=Gongylonema pulchrum TaxID=637853 RepID=A0A183D5Q4_9BILA|nr:unnamed protein product [Gongylonema pulchrum]